MAFLSGPRQVGKTTLAEMLVGDRLINWDDADERRLLLAGPAEVARHFGLDRLQPTPPLVGFDELHKFGRWKSFLKGFFDSYGKQARVLVTGSSRLEVFQRGGDSLMGRYLPYRIHPFSVGELARTELPAETIRPPSAVKDAEYAALREHGGYPEPFLRRDRRFTLRWGDLRLQQLLREDVRDLTRVKELGQLEVLARLLVERSATQLVYSNLATDVQVSVDTVRRWVETFRALHLGFLVRPWFRNVAKALRKEPRWFLLDWSRIEDPGARAETFVACHLQKAIDAWNDLGFGRYELRYLRDKEQREVDFIVVKDRQPWFLVEVKNSAERLSPALGYFQSQTKAPHAFQVTLDMDYVNADCFRERQPIVVPARTFLSQLI
jgi:predicted AAA+ superfamily ATPase